MMMEMPSYTYGSSGFLEPHKPIDSFWPELLNYGGSNQHAYEPKKPYSTTNRQSHKSRCDIGGTNSGADNFGVLSHPLITSNPFQLEHATLIIILQLNNFVSEQLLFATNTGYGRCKPLQRGDHNLRGRIQHGDQVVPPVLATNKGIITTDIYTRECIPQCDKRN